MSARSIHHSVYGSSLCKNCQNARSYNACIKNQFKFYYEHLLWLTLDSMRSYSFYWLCCLITYYFLFFCKSMSTFLSGLIYKQFIDDFYWMNTFSIASWRYTSFETKSNAIQVHIFKSRKHFPIFRQNLKCDKNRIILLKEKQRRRDKTAVKGFRYFKWMVAVWAFFVVFRRILYLNLFRR